VKKLWYPLLACTLWVTAVLAVPKSDWFPADSQAVSPPDSQVVFALTPGDRYRPEWEFVKKCSGLKPKKGGDYKDVKWLAAPPGSLMGGRAIGMWVEPDTIIVDGLYLDASWLVAHELMHHLSRGPMNEPSHPDRLFRSCRLHTWQNVPYLDWQSRREPDMGTIVPKKEEMK
jgi:hypothetical protein